MDLDAAAVKAMLSLNNVDNTADADKPISTAVAAALASGLRLKRRFFITASQTYAPDDAIKLLYVRGVAGGGGGGGGTVAATTSGTFEAAGGSGGAGGAYGELMINDAMIAASYSVTVGAAGAAGSSASGGAGGQSSFGTLLTLAGGAGGITNGPSTAASVYAGTLGGTGTFSPPFSDFNGDVTGFAVAGSPGGQSFRTSGSVAMGGNGASSPFGSGGVGGRCNQTHNPGTAASGYGAGGGGGARASSGTGSLGYNGGAGTPGVWEVWEFI
jgi:hypothetical protein